MNSVHSRSASLISASTSIQRSMVAIVPSCGSRCCSTGLSPPASPVKQRRPVLTPPPKPPPPSSPGGPAARRGGPPAGSRRAPAAPRRRSGRSAAGAGPGAVPGRGWPRGRRRSGPAAASARRGGGTAARLRAGRGGSRPAARHACRDRRVRRSRHGRRVPAVRAWSPPAGRRPRRRWSSATRRADGSSLAAHRLHACCDVVLELRAVAGRACFAICRPEALVEQARLTAREADVLVLVLGGLSNAALAERLCVSPATARTHCRALLRKFGAADRRALRARLLGAGPARRRRQAERRRRSPRGLPSRRREVRKNRP